MRPEGLFPLAVVVLIFSTILLVAAAYFYWLAEDPVILYLGLVPAVALGKSLAVVVRRIGT